MTDHATGENSSAIELVTFTKLGDDGGDGGLSTTTAETDSEQELLDTSRDGSQKSNPLSVLSRRFRKKSSAPSNGEDSTVVLRKELTVFSGVGFVVGQNIGSAIFITPTTILSLTGSFGTSIVLWVIGALVALVGAFCYIELGLLIRKSGAEYAYLMEAYSFKNKNRWFKFLGSLLAFLYSWTAVFYFRAAGMAVISLTCARYLTRPFFIGCCDVPESVVRLLAMSVLIILAIINCYSVKLAARVMTLFSVLKVVALVFIMVLGVIVVIIRGHLPADLHEPFKPFEGHTPNIPSIATALFGVTFAYDAWNVLNFSTEETRNLKRTLPLSLFIGIPIVAACYLLVNFAFFSVLTYEEILSAEAVAITFGYSALQKAGLVIVPLLVAISTFGAGNGNMFSSARLVFASARDGTLPHMFSGIHRKYRTPVPAVLLMLCVASVMVCAGNIYELISGLSTAQFTFYLLVFVGLLIMRITHRKSPRLYKGWFIVPITIFIVIFCVFMLVAPLLHNPRPAAIAYGVILLGVPVYIFLVMETPWKLRPKILDRISDQMAIFTNNILNTQSAVKFSDN